MATDRTRTVLEMVPLNYVTWTERVPVRRARALRVTAAVVGGAWGSTEITVKQVLAGSAAAIGAGVTLVTGARTALIDEGSMDGIDEVQLEVSVAAGASAYAQIELIQDDDT